jgi:hypothetical protein
MEMDMYKDSRWSKEIVLLQKEDGLWGYFHTLSDPKNHPITTEQALRRLQVLGYTIDDACIQKAVQSMHDCLIGKMEMPDRREKSHDWDIFTELMLSTWIRRFTKDDREANTVANRWAEIISFAFRSGAYSHEDYLSAYYRMFSQKAYGGRLIDFVNFYHVSLIADCLEEEIESAVFNYIIMHETGIYYIYNEPVCHLPAVFTSKNSSRYIRAIELLSEYKHNLTKLSFVVEWLNEHKDIDNKWDMGTSVKDFISFPLSDSWNKEARIKDSTFRIEQLISKISAM